MLRRSNPRSDHPAAGSVDAGPPIAPSDKAVTVSGLRKRFGPVEAVSGVSFSVGAGTIASLLGRSGCGKTTTLRMVAGLERIDGGHIRLDGRLVSSHTPRIAVPPEKRGIGFVFQAYALWPHLTVFDHVAYPLRAQRYTGSIGDRVAAMLELVGLAGFERRYPAELSGGQQQRVALARAVAPGPRVLLLDEPFSNLDAELRNRLRTDLQQVQRELQVTIIYVTHDKSDAMSLSDQIIVMDAGRVLEIGTPRTLYDSPTTVQSAVLIRGGNLLTGMTLPATSATSSAIQMDDGATVLQVPQAPGRPSVPAGEKVMLSVKPEDMSLCTAAEADVSGRVSAVAYFGYHSDLTVETAFGSLRLISSSYLGTAVGETVHLKFGPAAVAVIRVTDEPLAAPVDKSHDRDGSPSPSVASR